LTDKNCNENANTFKLNPFS